MGTLWAPNLKSTGATAIGDRWSPIYQRIPAFLRAKGVMVFASPNIDARSSNKRVTEQVDLLARETHRSMGPSRLGGHRPTAGAGKGVKTFFTTVPVSIGVLMGFGENSLGLSCH